MGVFPELRLRIRDLEESMRRIGDVNGGLERSLLKTQEALKSREEDVKNLENKVEEIVENLENRFTKICGRTVA